MFFRGFSVDAQTRTLAAGLLSTDDNPGLKKLLYSVLLAGGVNITPLS
jgi:hypothetical protein